jgi:GntR family transcriptional regulator
MTRLPSDNLRGMDRKGAPMAAKYERIADTLRHEIRAGVYPPGDRLPTGDALTARFKVSPGPVRQAIDLLESEGLVESRHGLGTFVRMPRSRVRRSPERYQWEKDRVRLPEAERQQAGPTEYDTGLDLHALEFPVEYDTIEASTDLAGVFDVSEGTRLLRRTYRTRQNGDDAPLQLIRSHLVHEVVAANPDLLDPSKEPWPGGTQHQLHTIGIELDRIVDQITARPPLPDEAEGLDTGSGVSLLILRKISIDTTDRVVEVSDVLMPGDRTELIYTTNLTRWKP